MPNRDGNGNGTVLCQSQAGAGGTGTPEREGGTNGYWVQEKGGRPSCRIVPFHKTMLCETSDLNHSWNGEHQAWDNGAMDGFTAANDINSANSDPSDPTGSRTMGYYTQAELPYYYSLYNTFATGDRYFQSTLTQTFPNRFYLLAGTSFGHIANDGPPPGGFPNKTIFELLGNAHVSWKIYDSQFAFGSLFSYVQKNAKRHVFNISQYYV